MRYNLSILEEYVEKGLLRKAEDDDLVQYNYSEKVNNAPMGTLWDDITMFNRGNIYEKKTGKLIARAMPKFLNLGQLSEDKQKELILKPKFNLTEKMDGCLGILYMYKGEIRCNSRGGFDNYVTDKIKELLPKYIMVKRILEHNTINVEVISPETKIICDYGDTQDLYLITAYSNNPDIGELNYKELSLMGQVMRMPVVKEYHMTWEALLRWQKEADATQEGFVVRFPNNERIKIKSEDYLNIAKLKCGFSKKRIWECMRDDAYNNTNTLDDYMINIPDELSIQAKTYLKELKDDLHVLELQANEIYKATIDIPQKELASKLKEINPQLSGAVFNIRNNKPIIKSIIKIIEPKGV